MPEVSVKVQIPEGYELACDKLRPVEPGEFFMSQLTPRVVEHVGNTRTNWTGVILRPVWKWPEWLKARWIAMDEDGKWLAYKDMPRCRGNIWVSEQFVMILSSPLLDFTPPPCDDWRKSLRENPNWKDK